MVPLFKITRFLFLAMAVYFLPFLLQTDFSQTLAKNLKARIISPQPQIAWPHLFSSR
ncbi:MAG: hypothetical protein HYU97_06850 [Deltaproteobacteria bacterium]|nr:hypothetical protein [Deltaproteobacteria bacterium]